MVRHRVIGNVLVAGLAVVVGIILSEAGLRLVVLAFPSWPHPVVRSWQSDSRNRAAPVVIGLDDWEYGTRYAPGLDKYREVFDEGEFHLSTSRRFPDAGFRDDRDSGDAGLVALGDSFTACFGVESRACWVNLLTEDLGGIAANLGVPATGALEQARRLRRWGPAYHPRLILWGFFGNDLWDNWYFSHSGPLSGRGRRGTKLWFYDHSILWRLLLHTRDSTLAGGQVEEEPVWYRTDGVEVQLQDWCSVADLNLKEVREGLVLQGEAMVLAEQVAEGSGSKLIVILIPTKEVVYGGALNGGQPSWKSRCDLEAQYAEVGRLADRLGLQVIDLIPAFKAAARNGKQLYYPKNPHWNVEGNRLAYRLIRKALVERDQTGQVNIAGKQPSSGQRREKGPLPKHVESSSNRMLELMSKR